MKLFADDTFLYCIVDDQNETAESLNSDLNSLSTWASDWCVNFKSSANSFMLLETTSTISLINNKNKRGKDVRFIFCDISKAFDRVWHRGLLYKLRKYGIKGNLLTWFGSYLSDRKQRVCMNGYYSTWNSINAGSDAQVLRLFKSEFRDSAVSF
jgi:hypothetical protein